MVKMRVTLLTLSCLIIIFCLFENIKAENEVEWKLDPEYLANLTIMSTNYNALSGLDISDSVDIIRIFKSNSCDGSILSISDILSKE